MTRDDLLAQGLTEGDIREYEDWLDRTETLSIGDVAPSLPCIPYTDPDYPELIYEDQA